MSKRIEREKQTIKVMIGMFCHDHHAPDNGKLCDDCDALWTYAQKRLVKCPFGTDKPACADCPVHCYKPEMRERVRNVMRYAGPRMLLRHPVLAIRHVIDGLVKPEKNRT